MALRNVLQVLDQPAVEVTQPREKIRHPVGRAAAVAEKRCPLTRRRSQVRRGQDPIAVDIESAIAPFLAADGAHVDKPDGQAFEPFGLAGGYFTKDLKTEFLHVLVIVDTRKVAGDSLRSICDYIAMLALTRMGAVDACSELPSIIELSSGCDERDKPRALTDADTAYLKALYSSDLEMNLNIEQADMRDRMVKVIMGR